MSQTRLSPEDIKRAIEELATNGEGTDRRWALNKLQETEDREVRLPEPLNQFERMERLKRVMRGAGRRMCQGAWRGLWPTSKAQINDPALPNELTLTGEELEIIDKVNGLKTLYRHFPSIKKAGVPTGFPMRGREVQKEWCQHQAKRMLLDRKARALEDKGDEGEPDV